MEIGGIGGADREKRKKWAEIENERGRGYLALNLAGPEIRSKPKESKPSSGSNGSAVDPMRQLLQQLTIMLYQKQENQKTSGMAAYFTHIFQNKKWILDSGATNHMTGNKNLLDNFEKYETKQFITVANGDKMEILGKGSITIFEKIIPNVLFIKDCTSNLLSIGKIAKELNCEIIFSSKKVIFQERLTKNMIGE